MAHTLLGHLAVMRRFSTFKRVLFATIMTPATVSPAVAQEVVEIHASPEVLNLEVGQRQRLFFSAFDAEGNIADRPVIRLSTTNALIASVDPDGTVLGVAPGVATLLVKAGRGSATVRVIVGGAGGSPAGDETGANSSASAVSLASAGAAVRRVIVSPPLGPESIILSVGESRRFSVVPLGADSTPVAVVDWSLSDSSVAVFDDLSGNLQARSPGATSLVARVPGLDSIAWQLEVEPLSLKLSVPEPVMVVGASQKARAVFHTASGQPFKPLQAGYWKTSDTTVADVDRSGYVSAKGLGRVALTVTSPEGDSASFMLTVTGDLVLSARGKLGKGVALRQLSLADMSSADLVSDGSANVFPARSPSMDMIAWSSDAAGQFDIYVMNTSDGRVARLTDQPGHHTQPVWRPDGRGILFASTRTGTAQIFEIAPDGSESRQVTRGETASHSPAISPDGSTLAVARGSGPAERVYLIDLETSETVQARLAEQGRHERSPRFFPDGDVAAVVAIGTTATAVVRWDRDRDLRVPLVTSDNSIREFAVSRDGRSIVVVIESTDSDRGAPVEVLLVDLATRQSTPLDVPLGPDERVANLTF